MKSEHIEQFMNVSQKHCSCAAREILDLRFGMVALKKTKTTEKKVQFSCLQLVAELQQLLCISKIARWRKEGTASHPRIEVNKPRVS